MSRVERCKEYASPRRSGNWNGESTADNISRWSERAAENSKIDKRAKGGEIKLPDTGGDVALHDTSAKPRRDREVDARAVAKQDLNSDGGSSFMSGVRRNA